MLQVESSLYKVELCILEIRDIFDIPIIQNEKKNQLKVACKTIIIFMQSSKYEKYKKLRKKLVLKFQ